ncbi:MAG: stalk domain-containing protein [Peptococcaceae bacterium]|jgi:hypothetical protein|nr:stalk domain-containing protein [Peptococcaceae bacterium]
MRFGKRRLFLAPLAALLLVTVLGSPAASPALTIHPPIVYRYTGVWQGQTVNLAHVQNVTVEGLPDHLLVGQITNFQTDDPNYTALDGGNINVFTAPDEFPGEYVVHNGLEGSQPVYGTWTFPAPGQKQNLSVSVSTAPGSFTAGPDPQQVTWSVNFSQPVSDGSITLSVTDPGGKTSQIGSGSPPTGGSYSFTNDWIFDTAGTWTLHVSWSGDSHYGPASGSSYFNVEGAWTQVGRLSGEGAQVTSLVDFGNQLYAGTSSDGVWGLNNGSWDQVGGPAGLPGQAAEVNVLATPSVPQNLYAGTQDGVWVLSTPWTQVGGANGLAYGSAQIGSVLSAGNPLAGYRLYAGTYAGNVWYWNGSSWSLVGPATGPGDGSWVTALAQVGTTLYAGGDGDGVWSWDEGSGSWTQVGSGLSGYAAMVVAILPFNGTLYAATHRGVWYLDGSSWTQLGKLPGDGQTPPGPASNITGLASFNGNLYAGTSDGVWTWNGSSWSQLGSLPGDGTVRALVPLDGALYAGTDDGVWSYPLSRGSQGEVVTKGRSAPPVAAVILQPENTGKYPIIIALRIGKGAYTVGGQAYTAVPAPFILRGRTFVSAHTVAQALGNVGWDLKIKWEPASRTASFSFGQRQVDFQLGSKTYLANGKRHAMPVAPVVRNGHICVPVFYLAQAFGLTVHWDGKTRQVMLEAGKTGETP